VIALIVLLIILTPLGLLAEGTAWGEWGADEIAATGVGYTPKGMLDGFSFDALIPDYSISALPDWVAYIMSAIIGVGIAVIVFRILSSLKKTKTVEA
jgi:cobalt/nickel transport system permease protein